MKKESFKKNRSSKFYSTSDLYKRIRHWCAKQSYTIFILNVVFGVICFIIDYYYKNEKTTSLLFHICRHAFSIVFCIISIPFVYNIVLRFYYYLLRLIRPVLRPEQNDLLSSFKEFWSILKDLLGKCWEWIKNNFITIIISIALFFCFLYYENKIVEKAFLFINKIKENNFGFILLGGLWLFLLFTIIYYTIRTTVNKTLPEGRLFFLTLVLFGLFLYCLQNYPWGKDSPIAGHEWTVCVLFVLYGMCFLVLPIIHFFRLSFKSNKYRRFIKLVQQGSYLSDDAIKSEDEDNLGFSKHILSLQKRIDEIPNAGTHSIAITGGWGKGKTSFLNLLQQKLNEYNLYEVMWFNPMKSSKPENIQNDFFDVLEMTLSKYKKGIGRRIKYYKELIGAIDNKYVSFLVKLGSHKLEDEKSKINDTIRMIPKKVIVIIDDVDRLKEEEIIEIFRLVRFNAKFDNVVFLLALDKDNIIKVLNCDKSFPDKFFEMEFPLPDNGKNTIALFVQNTMKKIQLKVQVDFLNDNTIIDYTTHCLSTLRDAKRFLNIFTDRIRMIESKLDIRSYYILSLIQYIDPGLYEQIKNQVFLDQTIINGKQCLVLKDYETPTYDNTITLMLRELFSASCPSGSECYIYQSEFFLAYFNETSFKSFNRGMLHKLLLSETEMELQQKLMHYSNDESTKQILIDMLNECESSVTFHVAIMNRYYPERYILNYYKVRAFLGLLNYSEGLAPIPLSQKKYAYIDRLGDIAFTIKCGEAHNFYEGLARIDKSNVVKRSLIEHSKMSLYKQLVHRLLVHRRFGFIDKEGKPIIPCIYDDAEDFSNGMARVKKDGKWKVIDKEGKAKADYQVYLNLSYVLARGKKDGKWDVKDGKWGVIDKEGKTIIPYSYDDVKDISNGLTLVKKDGKWGGSIKKANR